MDTLRGIESFVKAVENGSIAAAAKRMGISAAAASQNIARLEEYLGVRLLLRTTRSMALTESGEVYYEKVRTIVNEITEANAAVTSLSTEPQGRLCIASTAAFGRHVVAPLIPEFNLRYPRIAIELMTTDRNVDHIQESVDISIRIKQQLEDGMVARRIATIPTHFCAAPTYLARAGRPTTPEELRHHDCLVFRVPVDGRFLRWGFVRDGLRFEADVRATMISDDIDVLAQFAVAGGGITRLAAFVANPFISSGQLETLFLQSENSQVSAEIEPLDIYLCVRDRHQLTSKARIFMDYLVDAIPQEWRPTVSKNN
ncbi:MAG: LysR family transcriptional regulator [Gammaproteobacteria bacterium]|nr:MAG: LysR family transcriptional regulator [Gammaproteobacteria bacterium]